MHEENIVNNNLNLEKYMYEAGDNFEIENLEYNIGNKNFLKVKKHRPKNEFSVLNYRNGDYEDINLREEDNMNKYEFDRMQNKIKYDILELPDYVSKFSKENLESNFFKYNYKENIRSFKPIITNEGKKISFTIQSDVFIDNNFFVLNLMITNPNLNNWLQYDQSPIKNITITNNSQLIEEIFDYALIENIENDINYMSNFYNPEGNLLLNQITLGTKNLLIPPETLGTNTIFNPYQNTYDYLQCNQINNGKLSYKTQNSKLFQIRINSHVLGRHHTKKQVGIENLDQNLVPLFLYTCLQINIELNEFAFFVPVFNARIQDLTNVSINDNEYEFSRLLSEQNLELKKVISKLKMKNKIFVNYPRTISNIKNSKLRINIYNEKSKSKNLFECFSFYLIKSDQYVESIKETIIKFIQEDYKTSSLILSFINRSNFDEFNSIYNNNMDQVREDLNELETSKKKIFKFSYKLVLKNYLAKNEYDKNDIENSKYSTLLEIYILSFKYNVPIEFYRCETSDDNIIDGLHELTKLEFITLINGHINNPVLRIAFNKGYIYGILENFDIKETNLNKFIKNEDIFTVNKKKY